MEVETGGLPIQTKIADQALGLALQNLDECVLCDLCLEVGPKGAVQVRKLYE